MQSMPSAGRASTAALTRPSRCSQERHAVAVSTGASRDLALAGGLASGNHAFGLALLRAQAEYDMIRQSVRRSAAGPAASPGTRLAEQAETLLQLRTLDDLKIKAMANALVLADRTGLDRTPAIIAKIVGRCLAYWLDPESIPPDRNGSRGFRAGLGKAEIRFGHALIGKFDQAAADAVGALDRVLR